MYTLPQVHPTNCAYSLYHLSSTTVVLYWCAWSLIAIEGDGRSDKLEPKLSSFVLYFLFFNLGDCTHSNNINSSINSLNMAIFTCVWMKPAANFQPSGIEPPNFLQLGRWCHYVVQPTGA